MSVVRDNAGKSNSTIGGAWRLVCEGLRNEDRRRVELEIDSENSDSEEDAEESQATKVWNLVRTVHIDAPDLFSKPPNCVPYERNNQSSIFCYTPDLGDEENIRSAAEFIRSCVQYPATMYYNEDKLCDRRQLFMHTPEGELYKNDEHGWKIVTKSPSSRSFSDPAALDDNQLVPSEADQEYLCMPSTDDGKSKMLSEKGGKWMVFSPGNSLDPHDATWKALVPLYRKGLLVGLKASTNFINKANNSQTKGSFNRRDPVIHCYTPDRNDTDDVLRAADAIRRVAVVNDYAMFYKSNEASREGRYCHEGKKSVSMYLHTVEGGLYERDRLNRFVLIVPGKRESSVLQSLKGVVSL